jgi:5-formyltetrahydrofolate cyclo-ligase
MRPAGRGAAGVRYHAAMPEPAPAAGARLTGAALRDAKIALRRQVLGLRDALPADVRSAAGAAIAARVGALPSFMDARTLLLTLPFRSEWDTMPLVAAALAGGRTLALPRVDPHARMLSLHAIADADRDVAPGYRGIPEPRAHCAAVAPAAIDWVLVPGVAFDPAGGRLGYGGGYYDRLLPLLSPRAARVAGAFDVQVVASVPAAPHDLRVDLVVTETHTFRCPR